MEKTIEPNSAAPLTCLNKFYSKLMRTDAL